MLCRGVLRVGGEFYVVVSRWLDGVVNAVSYGLVGHSSYIKM